MKERRGMYSDTLYVYVLGLIAYGGNDNPFRGTILTPAINFSLSSARNLHPSQQIIDQYYPESSVVVSFPSVLWTSTFFFFLTPFCFRSDTKNARTKLKMPEHRPYLSIYSSSSSDSSTQLTLRSAALRLCQLEEFTDSSSSNGPTGFASQLRAPRRYRLADTFQTRDDIAIQTLKWNPPFDLKGPNGFKLDGCPTWYEDIQGYRPGGHHPVHLGDTLGNRYKVIHKLGHGGFANV